MKTKVCPDCGSDRVQELVAGWQNPNNPDELPEDLELAELYTMTRWCLACASRDKAGEYVDGCGPFKEVDEDNPPEGWESCGCCEQYHPPRFTGDCRDDANRWPGRAT